MTESPSVFLCVLQTMEPILVPKFPCQLVLPWMEVVRLGPAVHCWRWDRRGQVRLRLDWCWDATSKIELGFALAQFCSSQTIH